MHRRVALLLALLCCLFELAHAQAQPTWTGRRYSLRTLAVPGTTPGSGEIAEWRLPVDKAYGELTPEHRKIFRSTYFGLADDDEPPFPLQGLRGITTRISEAHLRGDFEGEVYVEVTVDASGNATEVAVRRSPGNASLQLVASAAMLATYKPALCSGTPCAMAFPLVVHFNPSRDAAEGRRTCLDGVARPEDRVSACTALIDSRALTADSATLMLRQRVVALSQSGDHLHAMADYDEVVRRLPADPGVYASRAFGRRAAGDWVAAVDDYDAALRLAPDPWNYALGRARALSRAGRDDQATAAYDALRRRVPQTSSEHVVGGLAALDRSDLDQAAAAFDRAIAADPRNATAWTRRADLRLARGDTAGALGDAEHATQLAPGWSSAFLTRGLARYFAGQHDAAVADFDEGLRLEPAHRYLPIWRGLARLRTGGTILVRAQMSRDLAGMDRARWPAPLLAMLLGRLDGAELNGVAAQSDRSDRAGRNCEAQFYRSEALLIDQHTTEALPLLEIAVRTCPPGFIEALAARAELRRLSP